MPDNASGYVDFNQYADLNSDEEQRLLNEAVARAEAADSQAQGQLVRSSQEAIDTGAQGISQTGSYSEYMKRKADSAKAWAAVGAKGSDPRSSALRGKLRADQGVDTGASAEELAAREGRLGGRVEEAYAGHQKGVADRARWQKEAEGAKQTRTNDDARAFQAYQESLRSKMQGGWAQMDAKQGSFGFDPRKSSFTVYGENLTPFGNSVGNEDSQRLAQQARNSGLGAEADRYQSGATYAWGKRTKGGY